MAVTAVSCKHTPEGVLGQEEMAQLMADIHQGEALIDFNYSTYPNDSTRKMLKQSIYASHNVSAEEVDTSYVWYGNHIEDYIKVYDRTIEIIQQRQRDAAKSGNMQISVAGDSVQVWGGPQRLIVGERMPSRIVGFNLTPDSTWQKGDIYTLCYKLVNSQAKVQAKLLVDYSNGSTAYVDEPDIRQSKSTLKIQVDSTLTPLRVYGYMYFMPEKNISFEIDSISLIRIRKELMKNVYIHKKTFNYGISPEKGTDNASQLSNATTEGNAETHTATANHSGMQPRQASETTIRRNSDNNKELPKPSSQSQRQSEHREDASLHKPTPAQRRDAARQRSATTRQQTKPSQHTIKTPAKAQKAIPAIKPTEPSKR